MFKKQDKALNPVLKPSDGGEPTKTLAEVALLGNHLHRNKFV